MKRVREIDGFVSAEIRKRRVILGMTQAELGAAVGVTLQQVAKYERGINRVSAGRLYDIACALGVEVAYFFEGLQGMGAADPLLAEVIELNENVSRIPDERVRAGLVDLSRVLAKVDGDG